MFNKNVKIFKSLQFLNEKNNYNNAYQQNNKKYINILSNVLFELFEDISENQIIYDYSLSIIIESYNSKMKEYYFGSELSYDFEKDLLLYELKIDIKKFLLNYNKNKNKIYFDALNGEKLLLILLIR